MNNSFVAISAGLVAMTLSASSPRSTIAAAGPQAPLPATSPAASLTAGDAASAKQLVTRYCVACHNERMKSNYAGLALDGIDTSKIPDHPEVWEKVVRKIRAGLMPPAGRPRPEAQAQTAFVSFLETELDRSAAAAPNPGRTEAFHRLNRAEYRNVVRDLLQLDIDAASLLPTDDAGYGFDNIAGVLKINQSQMEQYLAAARKISRTALARSSPRPAVQQFRVAETQPQDDHIEGLPFGTRGGLLARYTFPQSGEYEIAVDLLCRIQGECDGSVGFPDEHKLEIAIDGARAQLFTLEPRKAFRPAAERAWRAKVPVQAGPHDVTVAFLKLPTFREVDSRMERFLGPKYLTGVVGEPSQMIYQPYVDRVTITGPVGGTAKGEVADTPSRRTILTCTPAKTADEAACASKIFTALARRAYRRPVANADVEPLLRFYRDGQTEGGFEAGIERALQRLLISPEFLFRVERDPKTVAANTNYRISDLELASRLSFFLWSSIPDDELLSLAVSGKLHTPAVLERQVRRMLADTRSEALVSNFAGQWLQLRNLEAMTPDWAIFPNFDDGVRLAFRRETELFFESILRENRGIMELLTADYTFVNERLARHYGIPNIYGDRFRRVTLTDPRRRGLLGHGSVLLVTSRPNRTSVVLRGKWVLANILGVPPPDPPANVPPLEEDAPGNHNRVLTVRERMANHRKGACAGCHSMIDPLGFALENFDAVGRWRDRDDTYKPIDASGTLPDGTNYSGLEDFRKAILSRPDRFVTSVTERLLIYALGRGVEVGIDMPAIRSIVRSTAPTYTLSDVVLGITRSAPFQMRRSASQAAAVASAAPAIKPVRSSSSGE